MMLITYAAFVVLGLLCVVLQYWAKRLRNDPSVGNNPTFLQFQRGYFAAYYCALLADWLQVQVFLTYLNIFIHKYLLIEILCIPERSLIASNLTWVDVFGVIGVIYP